MLWLALQFPKLGLEVFEVFERQSERPTVLLEDNRVVLLNEAAQASGIAPGGTLATAHSITAGLQHHHRDEHLEQQRLQFLAEALYSLSAEVSIEWPDALLLEVGGSLKLFGDVSALAEKAVAICKSLGHETASHTATTPLAALVMARAGVSRLEGVALSSTGMPAKLVEHFANMGMRHLGDVLGLPEIELGPRFGPELVDFLGRLTGRLPDPRQCVRPAAGFQRSLHLLEPLRSKSAVLFSMKRLLNDLEHWLIARQLGAARLEWHFMAHHQAVTLAVDFAGPRQSQSAFLNITRLKLDQAELPGDVLSIELEAKRLSPWDVDNRSLFHLLDTAGDENADMGELVDELTARLGFEACSGIALMDQHTPEAAWSRTTLTGASPATAPGRKLPDSPLPRPLWLFDAPRPTQRDRLTLLKGPERLQTAWWQQTLFRDYYIARHDEGAKCWVFVDAQERWYLHGYFS